MYYKELNRRPRKAKMLEVIIDWCYQLVAFVVMLVCIPIYFFETYCRVWTHKKIPPLKPYPIFDDFWGLLTMKISPADFFKKIYTMTDKKLMRIVVFHKSGLLIRCPDLVKTMFLRDFEKFSNRYMSINQKFDNNLLTIKQPKWEDLRDKLEPILTSKKLANIFPYVKETGENLEEYLSQILSEYGGVQQVFDVEDISMRYAADAMVTAMFDVRSNCLSNSDSKFRTAAKKVMHLTLKRRLDLTIIYFLPKLARILRLKFFDKFTSDLLRKTTIDVVMKRNSEKVHRKDLMSELIRLKQSTEDKNPPDDESIVAQTTTFFTAGVHTVTCVMSCALYELGLKPELQRRLRDEIEQKLYDNRGELSHNLVINMAYLDMVISETLRKYPPIPFLSRECTRKTGYILAPPYEHITLKIGTPIFVSILGIHMDRKNFPEPTVFDPERFTADAKKARYPDCFIPFGVGPRACLGNELGLLLAKVGLIYFIRNYKINVSPKTPPSLKADPLNVMMVPLGEIPMEIEKIV